MEINLKKLSEQKAETTTVGGKKKMRLSDNASSMVFQMFTSTIYSNPIGTVVREITSNCFDSHIEAGVNTPVLIKKNIDQTDGSTYISFIDFGVGMSPDRVENIYGVYFESTKRTNNDEIGGFGIGGKTPLAYKRSTGHGEGEYDNSFFVITNYEGQKYIYNVFEGDESPEFTLLHQEETEEGNGTEIRIPVLERDVHVFEREIIKQLYYFENLIFEGFSDNVTNDYKIIRGENFLYRGDNIYNNVHVCLGKVAYPINYDNLGLNAHEYNVPVAINVPIGDISVVASREQLDYSENTIKYLKNKLNAVMEELKGLLVKQYENVQTLEDYFKVKSQFGTLYLSDEHSVRIGDVINPSDVDYSNFKFSFMKMPNDRQLLDLFFNIKVYGAREKKYTWRSHGDNHHQLNRSYDGLKNAPNIFYSELPYEELTLKRIKQSYLKNEHGRFYVITPKNEFRKYDVTDMFRTEYDPENDTSINKELHELQEQYMDIVRKYATEYEGIEVPEDFIIESKKPKLSDEIKKSTIPVRIYPYSKTRVKIEDLMNFKGIIFYGNGDDDYAIREAYRVFTSIYGNNHVADNYMNYNGRNKFGSKKGIMFMQIAKNNMKYVEYFKKPMHINKFYHKMIFRKEETIKKLFKSVDLLRDYELIAGVYKHERFNEVSPKWSKKVRKVGEYVKTLKGNEIESIGNYKNYFAKYFDVDALPLTKEEKKMKKDLEKVKELEKNNAEVLAYVNVPYYEGRSMSDTLVDILQKVMSF